MSVTAVGIPLDIDGPLPVAPEHSLLNTPGVVREATGRVLGGGAVWGYPTGCAELWDPCSTGTFRTKAEDSTQPTPLFAPYVVYKPINCSPMSLRNQEELNTRISQTLDAVASGAVEEAVAAGVSGIDMPFIGDANVDNLTPGGGSVPPHVGLSILENAIGATCRRGMILATPATVVGLQVFPFNADRRLLTSNGTQVVSADGIIGLTTPDLSAPADGEDWMLATGPIEVYMGPTVTFDTRTSIDQSDNTLVFRAERYVLSVWDTALQAAVLVDWTS